MHHLTKWIIAGLCLLLLLGTFACGEDAAIGSGTAGTSDGQGELGEDIVISQGSGNASQSPTDDPWTVEEPDPTPMPSPVATRPPKEGDVCTDRFPAYDTDGYADWSYQSDELRISIKQYENTDYQIVYYVADIWMRNINTIRMGFGNGKFDSGREEPEVFAARENAIFAVNGTMNSGLVIHNTVKKKNVEKSSTNAFRSGIVVIYMDGTVKTINLNKRQKFDYNSEKNSHGGIWQAFQFGPILVQDGEKVTGLRKNERHPRIIFGYVEPGHFIIVAVDGRTKKSIGMTETEMADLMYSLGCTQAMNLDGGNSASMVFMGEVINARSSTDRRVSDMVLFAEYDADGNAPSLSTVTANKFRGK